MTHTISRRIGMGLVTCLVGLWLAPTPLQAAEKNQPAAQAPAASARAKAITPSERELEALAKRVETLGQRILRRAKGSGMAIVLTQGDRVLLERGFGVTDTTGTEKVGTDTVFRLASLSKAFAGTLAAMLVEEDALRWDSRIVDYLPAFKLQDIHSAQSLTVQDILSHRVGIPHNAMDRLLEQDEPYPLLVAKLDELDSTCDAGDCYGYQNIAFSLIGDIVFATTGKFYSQQVEKRIFHPLGMYTATYGREALEASTSWARPHVRQRGRWTPVRPKETYYRVPPAAGVNASIHDLSLWLRAQLGHAPEVLDADLLATVHAPLVATPDQLGGSAWRRERLRDAHYALGWRVYDYAGHTLIFHAGAVQGYRAMIGLLPNEDFGVAIVWNSESGVPGGLLATILDQYLKLPRQDWLNLDAPTRRGWLR
ncbi:MAG TPA: serine hydrolase domain-containing protein [Chiayiivirga sp.]|nr:serine hydrolase domain-containing protein [Chiayiivirga sp.]